MHFSRNWAHLMKAVIYDAYGPPEVLRLEEIPKPVPKVGEVLIRVEATTVSSGDWRVRSLDVPRGFGLMSRLALGISGPRQPILGTELAGEVEAIGPDVSKFKIGDPVFAFSGARMGCHAEYKCMAEDGPIAPKPTNLSYDEAASLSFGGMTALNFLNRGGIHRGDRVLVVGASGAVGTAAVQLAKHFGGEVTGVCSARNVALVRSLGADHVIDYATEDFTRNGLTYDIIMDTTGTAPFSRCRHSLTERGRLLVVLGGLGALLQAPWVAMTSKRRIVAGTAATRREDLLLLGELAESGALKPVIDRRFTLEQIVEAHKYVDTGRKRGSVVICVGRESRRENAVSAAKNLT